jgi:hypothetical protein
MPRNPQTGKEALMKPFLSLLLTLSLLMAPALEAAPEAKHYKLYWRERNGEILLSTVCDNYAYGSIAYRGCRAQAKRHFGDKCRDYRNKEKNSSGVLRKRYRNKRQRFCHADSQFGAVD